MSTREENCSECGTSLELSAREVRDRKFVCPECGALTRLRKPKPRPKNAKPKPGRKPQAVAELRAPSWRDHHLRLLRAGLGIHSLAVLLTIVGIGAAMLGITCHFLPFGPTKTTITHNYDSPVATKTVEGAPNPATAGLFLISLVSLGAAGISQAPAAVLALSVPDAGSRWLLGLSMAGCAALLGGTIWAAAAPPTSLWPPWLLVLLGGPAAWFCWLMFLSNVARQYGDDATAEEAARHIVKAPLAVVMSAVMLAMIDLSIMLIQVRPLFGLFPAAVLGGSLKFAVMSTDKSLGEILLMPTGIPYLISYYNLIATIRNLLGRRPDRRTQP